MTVLLGLFAALNALAWAQNPTVSNITVTDLSHSTMLLHFDVSAPWSNVRIRYIPSAQGSCDGGKGGFVQPSTYPGDTGSNYRPQKGFKIILGGLQADTEYRICPEVATNDDGSGRGNYSSGQGITVKTPAHPQIHPAYPLPPVEYHPEYPDTSKYHQVRIAEDCSDFQAQWDTAIQHQNQWGTVLNLSPATSCRSLYQPRENPPDVDVFGAGAIRTEDSTITVPHSSFKEGQQLIFGASYSALPGTDPASGSPGDIMELPTKCTGIISGVIYFAHKTARSPDSFQLTCGAPFGAPGGQLMRFATAGWGNRLYVVRYPRPLNWIVIRTSTPEAEFAPAHTRVSPRWSFKMPKFVLTVPGMTMGPGGALPNGAPVVLLNIGNNDGNDQHMLANTWIEGLEFTSLNSRDAQTSTSPSFWSRFVTVPNTSQDIVFDRVYLHGQGAPNRYYQSVMWDGHNVAWMNSYLDKLDIFQSVREGLTAKVSGKGGTQFTITPGEHHLNGLHKYVQKSPITVSISGAGSGTGFVYASMDGSQLRVALPPEVTGTCSGGSCDVFTTDGKGSGVAHQGSSAFPAEPFGNVYSVDPIFSSSPSCSNTQTIFDEPSLFRFGGAETYEVGTRFRANVPGFVCGIRFNKPPVDERTTHAVSLWDANGKRLGTGSSSGGAKSGWISVRFEKPIPVTEGAVYTASYFAQNTPFWYNTNLVQNGEYGAGAVRALARYDAGNGSCNFSDAWPKNVDGNTAAGEIACLKITGGKLTEIKNGDEQSWQLNTDGCQCFVAGIGPGPYLFENNYFSGTGNLMHHDEGGLAISSNPHGPGYSQQHWIRGDYYYHRDTFHVPFEHMYTYPAGTVPDERRPAGIPPSDGLIYRNRQPLEWKSGERIKVDGLIFDGNFNMAIGTSQEIAMTSVCDQGIRDAEITNTTFQHVPGIMVGMSSTEGGCTQTKPPIRLWFHNNLGWDIQEMYWSKIGGFNAGNGWVSEAVGYEDARLEHNTIFRNTGRAPSILYLFDNRVEGVKITDNIFYLSNGDPGIRQEGGAFHSGPNTCGSRQPGKAFMDCQLPGHVFANNLLLADTGRREVEDWWPGGENIIPPNPGNLNAVGWMSLSAKPNFRLRPDAGVRGMAKARIRDPKDLGADIDILEAAQGKVTLQEEPAVTADAADINFTAPDEQGCPVDYSAKDASLLDEFKRVPDTGKGRARSVHLSGLASATTYHYRVNCMVEQPTGEFKTK
ncbi:MAG: DUF4082 domain-containing protein [Bryobacteraceae bacterium]